MKSSLESRPHFMETSSYSEMKEIFIFADLFLKSILLLQTSNFISLTFVSKNIYCRILNKEYILKN